MLKTQVKWWRFRRFLGLRRLAIINAEQEAEGKDRFAVFGVTCSINKPCVPALVASVQPRA